MAIGFRHVLAVSVVALLGVLWPSAALAKVRVVATLPALAAIAKEVGGPDVEVTALVLPTQDPHFVDARPHLVLPLNKADLLIANGLDLEIGWLPTLITGARNPRIQPGTAGGARPGYLDASTLVPLKQVPQQKIDRSMGDIHPGGNPHYLLDPRNGAFVALGIAERLSTLDPARKAAYQARAKQLAAAANALAEREVKRFRTLPVIERHVVVYHQSWIYLVDWLHLTQIGTIEPKPGIPPDPKHIAWLLGHMRKVHGDVILQESYYPSRVGQLLAEKAQATLLVLPGGPNMAKNEGYVAYMQTLADKIHAAVSK